MPEFLTYSKYYNVEDAEDITQLLYKNGIQFLLQKDKELLDKIYIGDSIDPMIVLKIQSNDFEKVNRLLKEDAKRQVATLPTDYYLLHFTNEELQNVLTNPNDWNAFDQGIAEELLTKRNVEIMPTAASNTAAYLYKPIEIQPLFLVLQYILSAFILCAGVVIGLATIYAYKTLSNGKKVSIFSTSAIIHGKIFIALGVVRLVVFLVWIYGL